jgi:hypothetical protein
VNWRKLWYELRFPTLLVKLSWLDYPAALKTAFRAKLGKAFVEYEQRKYFTFPTRRRPRQGQRHDHEEAVLQGSQRRRDLAW